MRDAEALDQKARDKRSVGLLKSHHEKDLYPNYSYMEPIIFFFTTPIKDL